jgi:hypothetical protein
MTIPMLKELYNEQFNDDKIESAMPFQQSLDFWDYEVYNSKNDQGETNSYVYFKIRKKEERSFDDYTELDNLINLSRQRREEASLRRKKRLYLESEKNQFQIEMNVLDQLIDQKFEENIILPNIQFSESGSEPDIEPVLEIKAEVAVANVEKVQKKKTQKDDRMIEKLYSAFKEHSKSTKDITVKLKKQLKSPKKKVIKKKQIKEKSEESESSSELSGLSDDSEWGPSDEEDDSFVREEKLREKAFHDHISRKKSVIALAEDHQKLIGIDSIAYHGDLKYIETHRKKSLKKNEILNYKEGMVLPNSNALPDILRNFVGKKELAMDENILANPEVDEFYENEVTHGKKSYLFDISQIKKKVEENPSSPEPEITNIVDFNLNPTKIETVVEPRLSIVRKPYINIAEILLEVDEVSVMTVDLNEDLFPAIDLNNTSSHPQKKKRATKVKHVKSKPTAKVKIDPIIVKEDSIQEPPKIVVRKGSEITKTLMKMHGLEAPVEPPVTTNLPTLQNRRPTLLFETDKFTVKRSVDIKIPEEPDYVSPLSAGPRKMSTLRRPTIINLDEEHKGLQSQRRRTSSAVTERKYPTIKEYFKKTRPSLLSGRLNARPIIDELTALGILDSKKSLYEQPRVNIS